MAISVKKITLWRREMDDRPGTLAGVLAPVAGAGASLRVVMAYRYPEPAGRSEERRVGKECRSRWSPYH